MYNSNSTIYNIIEQVFVCLFVCPSLLKINATVIASEEPGKGFRPQSFYKKQKKVWQKKKSFAKKKKCFAKIVSSLINIISVCTNNVFIL